MVSVAAAEIPDTAVSTTLAQEEERSSEQERHEREEVEQQEEVEQASPPVVPRRSNRGHDSSSVRISRIYFWLSLTAAILSIAITTPGGVVQDDLRAPLKRENKNSGIENSSDVGFLTSSEKDTAISEDSGSEQQQLQASQQQSLNHPFPLWLRRAIVLPDQEYWRDTHPSITLLGNSKRKQLAEETAPTPVAVIQDKKESCSDTLQKDITNTLSPTQTRPAWWQLFSALKQQLQTHQSTKENNDRSCPSNVDFRKDAQEENTNSQDSPPLSNLYDLSFTIGKFFANLLDPTLLSPSSHTLTDLIDKVLTSTPRLLAISNFLLTLTYILHSAVADWFLGNARRQNASPTSSLLGHNQYSHTAAIPNIEPHGSGEKMGGFLIFKLLLISAVVTPDTLDLLILLSWYTLLSFLRSLANLAAHAIHHASAAGQSPPGPVLQLLCWVGLFNIAAACSCVALFRAAGIGMVLLLTCDCALTALYVMSHILQHFQATWEVQHATAVAGLEEDVASSHLNSNTRNPDQQNESSRNNVREDNLVNSNANQHPVSFVFPAARSERAEERIQLLEEQHNRRIAIIESVVFTLQLMGHLLTVCHFVHIWSLHGVQFTLIDGVLCLHLHSAVSAASKKIAQRRNLHRIARDLDSVFSDATEMELRKAAVQGDVCCVCLSGMTTHVKKVACGHLYHAACLREVVERARSIKAARCPLCRAGVLDGQYHRSNNGVNNNNGVGAFFQTLGDNGGVGGERGPSEAVGGGEVGGGVGEMVVEDQSLFRVSTEGLVPSWLHIPNVSFEVVRRAPHPQAVPVVPENTGNPTTTPPAQQQQTSWLRRVLVMAGALPMSPEEEAAALEQLVDMFPQYDRADLLRELRERSSSEAVAESILSGTFSGVPR